MDGITRSLGQLYFYCGSFCVLKSMLHIAAYTYVHVGVSIPALRCVRWMNGSPPKNLLSKRIILKA